MNLVRQKLSKILRFRFGLTAGLVTVAGLAFVFIALPQRISFVSAENCPNPPTSAVLNYWPVSFSNPAPACHDFPALSGRVLSNPLYPQSQQELDNGLTLSANDPLARIRIFLHNGAAPVNTDPSQTTARNVKVTTQINNGSGLATINLTMRGDNTNTVNASYKLHLPADTKLELVPASGQLRDWQNNIIRTGFNWENGYDVGDLLACFDKSLFFYFDVRIVPVIVNNDTTLNLTKDVRNITNNESNFNDSTTAATGNLVEYKIVVSNTGNAIAQNVVVRDTGVSGINPNGQGTAPSGATGNLFGSSGMSVGNIAVGQNITITYQATVTGNSSGSPFINTARAKGSNTNEASDTARVLVNPVGNPLACSPKSTQTVDINQNVSFSASGGNGQFTWSAPGGNPDSGSGSSFTTKYSTTGNKTVTVTSAGQQDTCPVFVNTPPGQAVLQIVKLVRNLTTGSGLQNSVNASNNDRVAFQVTVTNIGSQTAINTRVTDVIPAGLNFDSSTVRLNGSSVGQGSSGINSVFSLSPGQQAVITFEATVNAGAVPNFTCIQNTATAVADNASQVQSSASVCVSQVQGQNVNLSFSKRAVNDSKGGIDATTQSASRGDFITYTLTVTNSGNAPANNFVITDDLSGVLPLADMVDNGGGTVSGNVISFPAVTVPAGGSVSKTFRVQIKQTLSSTLPFQMTNVYGNTVTINIGGVQGVSTFIPPKTGASGVSAATFAALITGGFVAWKKRRGLYKLIFV